MRYMLGITAASVVASASAAQLVGGDAFEVTVGSITGDIGTPGAIEETIYAGSVTYTGDGILPSLELAGFLNPENGASGVAAVFADAALIDPSTIAVTIAVLGVDDTGNFTTIVPASFNGPVGGPASRISVGYGFSLDPVLAVLSATDGIGVDTNFGGGIVDATIVSETAVGLGVGGGVVSNVFGSNGGFVNGTEVAGFTSVSFGVDDLSTIGLGGIQIDLLLDVEFIPTPGAATLAGLAGLAAIRRRR